MEQCYIQFMEKFESYSKRCSPGELWYKELIIIIIIIIIINGYLFSSFFFFFSYLQTPVIVMVPLPMRSYFHSTTKKVLDHLRAWWRVHHMQFTSTQVMVQHLVMALTSTLLTMPTVTLTPTHTLVTLTLFQVDYKTGKHFWQGLTTSHLMRLRCFILIESS